MHVASKTEVKPLILVALQHENSRWIQAPDGRAESGVGRNFGIINGGASFDGRLPFDNSCLMEINSCWGSQMFALVLLHNLSRALAVEEDGSGLVRC